MTSINYDQFSTVCRLCSTIHPQLKSLSLHSVIKMIEECAPVHVVPGDELPQSICEECLILLEKIILFRKTCLESETNFLNIYNESRELVEPKSELEISVEGVSKLDADKQETFNRVEDSSVKIEDRDGLAAIKNLSEDGDGYEDKLLPNDVSDSEPMLFENADSVAENFLPDSDCSESDSDSSSLVSDCSDTLDLDTDSADSDSETVIKLKKNSPDIAKPKRKKKFKCTQCVKVFYSHAMIGSHLQHQHKAKPFECTLCPKKFYYKPQFTLHERSHAASKSRKDLKTCELCNKVFLAQSHFDEHLVTAHGLKKPHGCLQCDRFFKKKMQLNTHVKQVHTVSNIMNKCEVCGKSIKENLKRHMLTHGERKIFNCPERDCSKTFFYQRTLDAHHKIVHEHQEAIGNVLCNICGAVTKSKSLLRLHMLSHTNDRPFSCDQCDKTYKSAYALKTHIEEQHLKVRPYVCSECGLTFFRNRNLNNHKRVHHSSTSITRNDKPFACDQCDTRYKEAYMLKNHIKHQHLNIRPYDCTECGSAFFTNGSLTRHKRTHLRKANKLSFAL